MRHMRPAYSVQGWLSTSARGIQVIPLQNFHSAMSLRQEARRTSTKVACVERILQQQRWFLPKPDTKIQPLLFSIRTGNSGACGLKQFQFTNDTEFELEAKAETCGTFFVVRDDLLHPIMGGNKLRKLDAILPFLESSSVTDVVTCGGCQSAHAAALAVACCERGLRAHLLLRGEKLTTPTGYNLISGMCGEVTYIPRSQYADREAMLVNYAKKVSEDGPVFILQDSPNSHGLPLNMGLISATKPDHSLQSPKKVAIVREGASDAIGLLGLIRLVDYLARSSCFGKRELQLVVDSGTGTTATGLAIGVSLLGLPWEVVGVALAGTPKYYREKAMQLLSRFNQMFSEDTKSELTVEKLEKCLCWVERHRPRKFGTVLEGEIEACRYVAKETGILVDPIYTLAAWEVGSDLAFRGQTDGSGKSVAILHTGGTMGLFGLAQRYPREF